MTRTFCDAAQSAANRSGLAQPDCDGPVVAYVTCSSTPSHAFGCVAHAARMLAATPSAKVFALEDSPLNTVETVRETAARL